MRINDDLGVPQKALALTKAVRIATVAGEKFKAESGLRWTTDPRLYNNSAATNGGIIEHRIILAIVGTGIPVTDIVRINTIGAKVNAQPIIGEDPVKVDPITHPRLNFDAIATVISNCVTVIRHTNLGIITVINPNALCAIAEWPRPCPIEPNPVTIDCRLAGSTGNLNTTLPVAGNQVIHDKRIGRSVINQDAGTIAQACVAGAVGPNVITLNDVAATDRRINPKTRPPNHVAGC